MYPGKYPPYDDGMKDDVFIHNATGGVLVGQVLCRVLIITPFAGQQGHCFDPCSIVRR